MGHVNILPEHVLPDPFEHIRPIVHTQPMLAAKSHQYKVSDDHGHIVLLKQDNEEIAVLLYISQGFRKNSDESSNELINTCALFL